MVPQTRSHIGKISLSLPRSRLRGRIFPKPEPDREWRPDGDPRPDITNEFPPMPDPRLKPYGECMPDP
jgi:hypothetical protein